MSIMLSSTTILPIFVLLVTLCGLGVLPIVRPTMAHGQSVTSRAASSNDEARITEPEDGGSSRTTKHLSAYRMMHFGKRPLVRPAPEIVLDLHHEQQQQLQRLQQQIQPRHPMPYALYFELPRDQVLEFVQPDDEAFEIASNSNARDGLVKKQSLLAEQEQQQQSQSPQGQQEQQDASGASNGQQDSDEINLASRSVPMARGDAAAAGFPGLSRAHISSLLYGRRINEPQGSLLTLGSFMKKAEPQRMTFMHFGRRR